MNISEWRDHAMRKLADTTETAALDAELLLAGVLGQSRAWLRSHGDTALSPADRDTLQSWLEQRCDHVPLAYLTGEQAFWTLTLTVTPGTLVPRPETEHLVEQALTRIPPDTPIDVADLGTGSGAVALAIASERPQAQVVATDLSEAALAVARDNAKRLGISNVRFRHGDWFDALPGMRFDVIASNPPYVEAGFTGLDTTLRHEPRDALAAGDDGLDDIRRIVATAGANLRAGGHLLLEHGHRQGPVVSGILLAANFQAVDTIPDLAGHDRITTAQWPGSSPD
ncbi:MAG: peptide chain release factor N(5)-glutamine methyltransferase [Pseudomonadota bacterium]